MNRLFILKQQAIEYNEHNNYIKGKQEKNNIRTIYNNISLLIYIRLLKKFYK